MREPRTNFQAYRDANEIDDLARRCRALARLLKRCEREGDLRTGYTVAKRLTRYHEHAGDWRAVVECYERLAAMRPDSGQIHYRLGTAYWRTGDLGRSTTELGRARRAAREFLRGRDAAESLTRRDLSSFSSVSEARRTHIASALFGTRVHLRRGDPRAAHRLARVAKLVSRAWDMAPRVFRRGEELSIVWMTEFTIDGE